MTDVPTPEEVATLAELRRVLDMAEPLPPDSTTLARAALDWRTIDAELAELVHDSAVDEHELLVRGDDDRLRVLTFRTSDIEIEVEYSNGQLVGQVVPAEAATIELHREGVGAVASATTDEIGSFVIADVAAGPLSLLCRADDGRWSVRTSWTSL